MLDVIKLKISFTENVINVNSPEFLYISSYIRSVCAAGIALVQMVPSSSI